MLFKYFLASLFLCSINFAMAQSGDENLIRISELPDDSEISLLKPIQVVINQDSAYFVDGQKVSFQEAVRNGDFCEIDLEINSSKTRILNRKKPMRIANSLIVNSGNAAIIFIGESGINALTCESKSEGTATVGLFRKHFSGVFDLKPAAAVVIE